MYSIEKNSADFLWLVKRSIEKSNLKKLKSQKKHAALCHAYVIVRENLYYKLLL